jgi:N-methylhydantoinase A
LIQRGSVTEQSAGEVAGRPLALPMLDVHTVGAGGGSIAWRDAGGALRVGPQSAGADPGPACYGRGGTEPTVTDANLLLGYLAADSPLAGGVTLDVALARRAVGNLASALGLELLVCAEGIVRVANAEMVRALRVVTVERGVDPRRHALLAFGGAGPLHAAQIAEDLGIETIVCPRNSGVLAALGLVVSPRRRDAQRSLLLSGGALSREAIGAATNELGERARAALGEQLDSAAELRATFELRYRGQAFELAVAGALDADPNQLREAFEAEHEERYGYSDREQQLELVTVRVSATVAGADLELRAERGIPASRTRRTATVSGERVELDVVRGAPPPGTLIAGPAVVELPESTLLVPAGWSGATQETGTVRLTRTVAR